MKLILTVCVFIAFFSCHAYGQPIPAQMNYQGILKDASGNTVKDTVYTMVFKIYNVSAGGTALWSETQNVQVVNGLFNVELGSVNPISNVSFDHIVYLGITVGSGDELVPRTILTPSPYAFTALNVVNDAITTDKIKNGAVTRSKLGPDINISSGGTIGGNIAKITAGSGLTAGGDSADVILNVGAGSGIRVTSDLVSVDTSYFDVRFVKEDKTNSISANMITPNIISSLEGVSNDGGNIDLVAGNNISIAHDNTAKTITISALTAGDNLGNHTATQNIKLNSHWLSGDGSNEGVYVNNLGSVGIGTSNPLAKLDVRGNISSGVNGSGGTLTLAALDNSSKGGQINWNGAATNDSWVQASVGNNMSFSTNSANIDNLKISNAGDGTTGLKVQGNLQVGIDTTYDSKMIVNGSNSLYALNVFGGSTYCLGTRWSGSGLGAALVCVNDGTDGDAIQVLANGSGRSGIYARGSHNIDYLIYSDANGSKWAGYFAGNVYVNGRLTKSAGSFKIDDPIDPANKYLYHSFVESPDMKNIYDGIAVLDNNGEAIVNLPDWFEALNKDFRYQLTCIGGFAPVYIAEEISDNRFKIAGGKPGMKVSWMVTGIRHDAYANKNRIPVEAMKAPEDRGKYLHPEVFGLPESRAINYQGNTSVKMK